MIVIPGTLPGVYLGQVLGAVVAIVFFGAFVLATRDGLNRADRQMTFVLEDDRSTRKRPRFPDVTIAFSDIGSLKEELKWLVVESAGGGRKISISRDVEGYEQLRAELLKQHPMSPSTKVPWGALLTAAAPLLVSIAAWAVVESVRDLRIVILAGVVVVLLLGFSSYRTWIRMRMGWLALICLAPAWIIAAILIYRAVWG